MVVEVVGVVVGEVAGFEVLISVVGLSTQWT